MKLGFYYHIPAITNESGVIGLPAFFGKFVDSLAEHVTHLYCFFHSRPGTATDAEYWCKEQNITLASLGHDRPAYIKAFLPRIFFDGKVRKAIADCDAVIVRGPSPLAPYFRKFDKQTKIVPFLVGSYGEGSKYLKLPFYKEWAVRWLVQYMHRRTIEFIQGAFLLVNSKQLENEYGKYAKSVKQVFTTTLTDEDFYEREDTCQGDTIRLLYTGRLDWAKGLGELFDAFASLQQQYGNFELHFVGWEETVHKPVETALRRRAKEKGLNEYVYFHGRKAVGPELFYYYRMCDIYVLPSYHEGFPRTIWEAMANCLPVICTPVGAIPHYLENQKEALFVAPKNIKDLTEKLTLLQQSKELRKKLIKNAFLKASTIRLDVQNQQIINFVNEEVV